MIDRLEGLAFNVAVKAPCACVATANIPALNGLMTIDGVALAGGERVLVTAQTDPTTNGIYVANTSNWARDVDFANPTDCAQGTFLLVVGGTANAGSVWELTTVAPLIGTTSLTFSVMGANALSLASSWIKTNLLPAASQAAAQAALGVSPTAAVILASLLTTRGDIIVRGTSAPGRLGLGANGSSLMSNGTDVVWGAASAIAPRSYLAGLGLSNDSGTPNSILDIAAGICADSANAVSIILGAFTKTTGGAWVAGTGNAGMGGGLTIADSTWYHVFAIINAGTADVYFDTSAAAANKPASTTAFRRIGSFLTDGSAHIVAFVQNGDLFAWVAGVNDVANLSNPGTSAISRTLTVPTSVVVQAWFSDIEGNVTTNRYVLWTSLDQTDVTPSATAFSLYTGASGNLAGGDFYVKTNTSAQVRYRTSGSGASDTTNVVTKGWIDRRGRDA